MNWEFGLTITGYGVLTMFSALVVIVVACEILRAHKCSLIVFGLVSVNGAFFGFF
jgi:hypothetical protein